ncbi:hypothetical protein [Ethanoligenens harbinense]|nr:hypothetical protein [Ethanoligenens harbinense]
MEEANGTQQFYFKENFLKNKTKIVIEILTPRDQACEKRMYEIW